MAPSHTSGHSEGTPSHNSDDESDYHEHELRNYTTSTRSKAAAAANSKKKPSTSRRASHSATTAVDDSLHVMNEDSADPQNARKMQNRLAQREFRARRLEHIKELEARVEFLSKPQSEQTEILVAIIHGLMDENKQLRGSLKTMANFVSTGIGGFSNAIQLPKYDNALELVNRGDRALLLKLVQEKGASVGGHASGSGNVEISASVSPLPTASSNNGSTTTSHSAHDDKKRKMDTATAHDASNNDRTAHHPSAAKAPRTRSQNQRTRQERQKGSDKQQQETSSSRKVSGTAPSGSVNGNNPEHMYQNGTEAQGQYREQPRPSMSETQIGSSAQRNDTTSRATDIFPSYLGAGNSLDTFDIFSGGSGNASSNAASASITPSFQIGGNFVKQEESPPLPAYGDSASAWMNAYTNLTPVGGNESFWSLTSSAMNNQQPPSFSAANNTAQQSQQQPQQQQMPSRLQAPSLSEPQDGRSPSSAYLSTWGSTAAQMLASNATFSNSFSPAPLQSMQPPLHGYA